MKIGIIGAGAVGSATAFSLIMTGVASKIVLIDINRDKAQAEASDIAHAAPYGNNGQIIAGDYKDLEGCQVVIVAAGVNQKEGETRLDLLAHNVKIFAEIMPKIGIYAGNAVLLIATNPADIMTAVALNISGFPEQNVIGSGTVLDTSRFRTLLASHLELSPKSVHADVLGEHGDSEVLIWSNAEAGTLSLEEYAQSIGKPLSGAEKEAIRDGVVNAAYKIIAGKGATSYGIAGAITQICRAIGNNENCILTLSSFHHEVEGVKDVCLSLPTVINRNGIKRVIIPNLSEQEHKMLRQSAQTIKEYTQKAIAMISE